MKPKTLFLVAALLGAAGVTIGAFGAHALPNYLAEIGLDEETIVKREVSLETGVRYQMYHGLGLLALAWAISRWPERRLVPAAWLLLGGTVVFSGSLYLLVLTGARWFGAITPVGGVALIAGWALVAWRLLTKPRRAENASL